MFFLQNSPFHRFKLAPETLLSMIVPMKCPRTGNDLKSVTIEGITVDLSETTGGVWLDNYELIKFDEVHEKGGDVLSELMEKHRSNIVDLSPRIQCPKCENMVMARHYYSPKREIEIDRCPNCGGVWLDAGELAKIRELFPTEADREQASQELVNEAAESSEFQQMVAESEENAAAARKFANLFSWLCPSRYIPGKQDGAAF